MRGGTYGKDNAMVFSITWASTADHAHEAEEMTDGSWHQVFRTFLGLRDRTKADSWDPYPAYTVNSGTADNPITIKNYPGELPVLDCTGFIDYNWTDMPRAGNIDKKSYWIIDGLEMVGGIVNMHGGGTNSPNTNTHDITIQNCDIHDVTVTGGDNPGLIRIDSASVSGGAYNIYIRDNKLHDMFDPDFPGDWSATNDPAHYGAFTELSVEQIVNYAAGPGTRNIEITGNEIYNVPQVFFFKKITGGPFLVQNNIIHDSQSLAMVCASNVTFIQNIVYNVPWGFYYIGSDYDYRNGGADFAVDETIAGNSMVVEYNTFVGMTQLMSIGQGHSHTVRYNIIFGLTGMTTGANAATRSYMVKEYNPTSGYGVGQQPENEDRSDKTLSMLYMPTNIVSDYNGFISPNISDFQMAARLFTSPDAAEHYTHGQALATFGLDPNSVFTQEASAANIFTDPAAHDYTLLSPSTYPGMGYYAYGDTTTMPTEADQLKRIALAINSGVDATATLNLSDSLDWIGANWRPTAAGAGGIIKTPIIVEHADGTCTPYSITADTDAARGVSLAAAIAAYAVGDTIILSRGTYQLASAAAAFDFGTANYIGAGMRQTKISYAGAGGMAGTPAYWAGDGAKFQDLQIDMSLRDGTYQYGFSPKVSATVRLKRCLISGSSDSVLFQAAGGIAYLDDCELQSEYDNVNSLQANVRLYAKRCTFSAIWSPTSNYDTQRCVVTSAQTNNVYDLFNCRVSASSGHDSPIAVEGLNTATFPGATGSITARDCRISVSSVNAPAAMWDASGVGQTIYLSDCYGSDTGGAILPNGNVTEETATSIAVNGSRLMFVWRNVVAGDLTDATTTTVAVNGGSSAAMAHPATGIYTYSMAVVAGTAYSIVPTIDGAAQAASTFTTESANDSVQLASDVAVLNANLDEMTAANDSIKAALSGVLTGTDVGGAAQLAADIATLNANLDEMIVANDSIRVALVGVLIGTGAGGGGGGSAGIMKPGGAVVGSVGGMKS